MCAYCRYLDATSGSKYFARNCGGVIQSRVNGVTGELIPVDFWVNDIDPEDWEWFRRQWDDEDTWNFWFERQLAGAP